MVKSTLAILTLICIVVTGCTALSGYTPPQQQGNLIDSSRIKHIKAGMRQQQVIYLLGNPVLKHVLNAERWDYVYTYSNQGQVEQRKLSIYFKAGHVTHYDTTIADKAKA